MYRKYPLGLLSNWENINAITDSVHGLSIKTGKIKGELASALLVAELCEQERAWILVPTFLGGLLCGLG